MTRQLEYAEDVRDQQREEWTAAAPGWRLRRDEVSRPTRPITERLIATAGIRPGQRVLDLACGVGDPAFTIAELVGPDGYVLGLDITTAMVEGARAYARRHGKQNAEFRVIPNELELDVPVESFDVATCRAGLMYMPDPITALRALRDALKPGGRVAVSTWGPAERCPFFAIPVQIIARHVELPPPDPTAPGPFALPTRETLERTLSTAGFTAVESVAFETSAAEADSPRAYWDLMAEIAGPLVPLLASLPEEKRQAIQKDATQTLGAMFPEGPVKLGGEHLVAAGAKAS